MPTNNNNMVVVNEVYVHNCNTDDNHLQQFRPERNHSSGAMSSTVKMESNSNSLLVHRLRRASHKVVKLSKKLHAKQQQQSQQLPKNLDPGKAAFFARNKNRQRNIEAKAKEEKDNEAIKDAAVETNNRGNQDDILECYTIEIDNDHKYPALKHHQLQQIAHSINNGHNSVVVVEDSKDDNYDAIVDDVHINNNESLEEYLLLMHKSQHKTTTTTAGASTLGSIDGCSRSRTAASICSGSTAMVNNKTLQPGLVKASSEVRLRYQHYYRDAMSNLDEDTATLAAATTMKHAGLEYHPHILTSTAEEKEEEEEKEEPAGFSDKQDSKQQLDTIIVVEQQTQYGKTTEISVPREIGENMKSPTYSSVGDNHEEESGGQCGGATPCRVGFFRNIVCGAVVRPKSSKAALSGKKAKKLSAGADNLAWLGSPIDDDITGKQPSASSDSSDDEEEDNCAWTGENQFVLESMTVVDSENPSCVPICAASVAEAYDAGKDNPAPLLLPQYPRKQAQDDEELVKKRWHKQFLQQSVKRMMHERNKTHVVEDSKEKEENVRVSTPLEAVDIIQQGTHDDATNTFAASLLENEVNPSSSIDVLLDVHLEVHSNEDSKRCIERSLAKEEKEERMLNDILEQILPLVEEPQYHAGDKKESNEHAPIATSEKKCLPIAANENFANFDDVQVELNFPAFVTPVGHHQEEEKEGGIEFEAHGLLLEEPDGRCVEEKQTMEVQDKQQDSSMSAGNICRDLEELQDLRRPLEMAAAKLAPPPPPPLPSLENQVQLQSSHEAKTEVREGAEGDPDLVLEEAMQQVVLDTTFATKGGTLDLRESTCELARARGSIFDDAEGSVETEDAILEKLGHEDEETLRLKYGIFDDADGPHVATETDLQAALPQMSCFSPAYGNRPFDEITIGDPQFDSENATAGDDDKSEASTVSTLGLSVTMEPNDVIFKCIGVDISKAFMQQVDKCVDTLDVYPDEFDEGSFGDTIGETVGDTSYEKLDGDGYTVSF